MATKKRKTTAKKKAARKPAARRVKERRPVAKKFAAASSVDVDRVVREEVTEWFTSNRKGLETVFRRVADQVREDLEESWGERLEEEREKHQTELRSYAEDNAGLRERARNLEEEMKRLRSVMSMVRSQVAEEAID